MNSRPIIKSFLGTDTSYIANAPPFHTPRLGDTIPKRKKKERQRGTEQNRRSEDKRDSREERKRYRRVQKRGEIERQKRREEEKRGREIEEKRGRENRTEGKTRKEGR